MSDTDRLEAVESAVGRLTERFVTLLYTSEAGTVTTPPDWNWNGLTQEQAAARWRTFCAWVAWLTRTYEWEATWPECWAQHPGLVEELLALHAAHTAAYWSTEVAADTVQWHDALWRFHGRLVDTVARQCSAGHRLRGYMSCLSGQTRIDGRQPLGPPAVPAVPPAITSDNQQTATITPR